LLTESQGIFEKKLQEVKEAKPDVLILTGDLTYQGEKASHEVVSSDLINLKTELQKSNSDFKIVLVPGEGDINNKSATSYNSAVTDSQLTSLGDYKTMYASVCYDDALEKYTPTSGDSGSLAYSISVANDYNFVVMDDIRYTKETTTSTSTKSLTPQGIIESKQLAFLKAQTLAFRKKGQAVIGLNHHSLSAHYLVQSTLGYTITENASTVTKTLADAGMSVVFTGHESLNDVSCYHSSKDDLYDICTSASTLYPGNTRTVDFIHTYSYSKKSETLNFKSSLQATTDVSYLDTDKQTKTIDDLSSTLKARTLTSAQIAQEAKALPYDYLYSSYPDLKPDKDGNQNKTLGDVLDGLGYSAKEINSQISAKIGTPTAPTYIKDGSIFTKTAGSDYKVDSDGNAIDYDLVLDYGIHSNFSTTSDSYRIVLSGDYIKNTLAPNSSIFTGTVYDIVFYVFLIE
jgi:3',5'-cyclic AMP phosphodiesterase CpdA